MSESVTRNVDVSFDLDAWLRGRAKANGRAVKREIEQILERERKICLETDQIMKGDSA